MHTLIKICKKDFIYLRLFLIGALKKEFRENCFLTFIFAHDMVSAKNASSEPQCYKNLMGHRMHEEGPQIYQINRHTNNFQNMCDML